ncbi:EamA-like transporter family protein [Fulvimarina manganoxydans]|uniref:EamA-like transporter family protein n=1 Tax=Fulvimarina manganoxydans TaxID=937218 RepID=A0A1W1ZVE1_9HYPH|nr:DMT family transporter [Fulvimarina manganoxydans]MEE2952115.1 DMT family transporter [Pseudomonadota bacterium]SMC52071.1 EamA-like transporter family protein [Fulvimarina manganoxydans]
MTSASNHGPSATGGIAAPSPLAATMDSRAQTATGLAVVGAGGMVLSFDIPLIELSESGFWTVLCLRGIMTSVVALLIWAADRMLRGRKIPLIPGRIGALVTFIFCFANAGFVLSIYLTNPANVVFILAFNPVFAALFGWLIAGERPSRTTLLVIPVTIVGVAMIIGSGLETGNWIGDLVALATACLIALALTLARRSRQDFRYTSAIAAIGPSIVALPFFAGTGLESETFGWLFLNGAVVIPLAMILLAAGPLFVPAPLVSLAYLLETVFAPIWLWMLFGDRPTNLALCGGALIVAALLVQSLASLAGSNSNGAPAKLG